MNANPKKLCPSTGKPIRWCKCGLHVHKRLLAKRRRAASRAHSYRRSRVIAWQWSLPEIPANEVEVQEGATQ